MIRAYKTEIKPTKKQILKVQRFHHRLDNIRTDYINKTISNIVKQKPSFITIEKLNKKDLIKVLKTN